MSDSREQFEAWVRENWPEQSLARFSTGEYQGFTVDHCWNAWQASRQALVVELPSRSDSKYMEYFPDVEGGAFNEQAYLTDFRSAIEAAGVRVKPCS
ncbi:hypothetical protein [Pseudomonas oryzihabitans]|uniref:hypothetical protein n=1 Tax=Pseudomonas oryzihabitans TaxID=47885 RepID=UPI002893A6DB|nr:hypothetical protein [Pseudomonas oryzihabitans]MDT3718485.1 hypothetical protein [Pseudomonas oryzihabitans]